MKQLIGIALISIIMVGLTSCSPVKPANINSYMLNATPSVSHHARHASTILVLMPETIPVYNTTQMAYTICPYQVAYFTKNQWAETPSQMLQPLLVQTLQNTHAFHAVVTPPFPGRYDYMLGTQILVLQQNFIYQRPMLQFTVRAQLMNVAANKVVATREFSVSEPILQKNPYNGVIAANRAAARILREIADFCARGK